MSLEIVRSEHNIQTDKQEITAILDADADLSSLPASNYSVGSVAIVPGSPSSKVYMLKPSGWTQL